MRVLITGGNRYMGLELVRELARGGHAVTVINSHVVPLPEGVAWIHATSGQPDGTGCDRCSRPGTSLAECLRGGAPLSSVGRLSDLATSVEPSCRPNSGRWH